MRFCGHSAWLILTLQRGSSTRENVGRSSLSQGNQSAAAGAVKEDQNPPNPSSSAAETARFLAAFTIFCFSLFDDT